MHSAKVANDPNNYKTLPDRTRSFTICQQEYRSSHLLVQINEKATSRQYRVERNHALFKYFRNIFLE